VSFELKDIRMIRAGTTSMVAGMCEELRLEAIIDGLVEWDQDQVRVAPGTLAKAMVINVLDGRTPLYLLPEYFAKRDTEALLGKGIAPEHVNDDAVGRMLDRVAKAGPQKVFQQIVWSAVQKEHLDLSQLHSDTTSQSVYGAYAQEGGLNVTYGHSKDLRPDLKQIMYGLVVNREGVPVLGRVLDGNHSDKTWNGETLDALAEMFSPEQLRSIIYVADSAFVTPNNLEKAEEQKLCFISRFPNTYDLAAELKQTAWEQGTWVPAGRLSQQKGAAQYQIQEFERELYGRSYRFVVVHSSHLDTRKEKTLARRVEKERQELNKEATALQKQQFTCQADADKAALAFVTRCQDTFHHVQATADTHTECKRRPGRPKKGEEPTTETWYQVSVTVGEPDAERLKQWRQEASLFILITNRFDTGEFPPTEILREYKEQTSVEVRFRFLKDPYFVDQLYLKDKGRLEAFAYLLLTALLIYTLLERRVRQALAQEEQPLVGPGKVKHKQPTARVIFELLSYLDVLLVPTPDGIIRLLPANTPETSLRALRLVGFGPDLYTRPHPAPSAA
jgi:transposase